MYMCEHSKISKHMNVQAVQYTSQSISVDRIKNTLEWLLGTQSAARGCVCHVGMLRLCGIFRMHSAILSTVYTVQCTSLCCIVACCESVCESTPFPCARWWLTNSPKHSPDECKLDTLIELGCLFQMENDNSSKEYYINWVRSAYPVGL